MDHLFLALQGDPTVHMALVVHMTLVVHTALVVSMAPMAVHLDPELQVNLAPLQVNLDRVSQAHLKDLLIGHLGQMFPVNPEPLMALVFPDDLEHLTAPEYLGLREIPTLLVYPVSRELPTALECLVRLALPPVPGDPVSLELPTLPGPLENPIILACPVHPVPLEVLTAQAYPGDRDLLLTLENQAVHLVLSAPVTLLILSPARFLT